MKDFIEKFSALIVVFSVGTFYYTLGYLDFLRVPETPGVHDAFTFFLRGARSLDWDFFARTWTIYALLIGAYGVVALIGSKRSKWVKSGSVIVSIIVGIWLIGKTYDNGYDLQNRCSKSECSLFPEWKSKESTRFLIWGGARDGYWLNCKPEYEPTLEVWNGTNVELYTFFTDPAVVDLCKRL